MDKSLLEVPEKTKLEACFFGFRQPYSSTLSLMHALHEQVSRKEIPNQLMLLEHTPVITVTRQHLFKSIKTSRQAILTDGIELAIADRGGDVTFHGPGQLVGYPIIGLESNRDHQWDIGHYIRSLELSLLNAVQSLGITSAEIVPGFTGIWVKVISQNRPIVLKKLVAIGVGIKDGVTKHGFAMNIAIDPLPYMNHIVPCGLKDRGIITLNELFSMKSLEMPRYSAIVNAVSECLSHTFSLTLMWRS